MMPITYTSTPAHDEAWDFLRSRANTLRPQENAFVTTQEFFDQFIEVELTRALSQKKSEEVTANVARIYSVPAAKRGKILSDLATAIDEAKQDKLDGPVEGVVMETLG